MANDSLYKLIDASAFPSLIGGVSCEVLLRIPNNELMNQRYDHELHQNGFSQPYKK